MTDIVGYNEEVGEEQQEKKKEMSFLDHLEELRWHIIRSVIAILTLTIVAFVSKDILFHTILFAPTRADFITYKLFCNISSSLGSSVFCIEEMAFTLQSRKLTGQFTMHLMASFVAGIVVAFPYLFWEIWRFIKPALHGSEKKFARGTVFSVSTLFFLGVSFGFFILAPISVNFLANYTVDKNVNNIFDITNYISFLTTLLLGCGIIFQLPVFSFFLARAGLITTETLKAYRKHAIIVILVISAVITPPDIVSQIGIGIPIFFLYEFSISITSRVEKKRLKTNEELVKDDQL